MDCQQLKLLLSDQQTCEKSEYGTKIITQCLYPSADPVYLHIAIWGDGYRVTDGGGILQSVLLHGCDKFSLEAGLKIAKNRHGLIIDGGQLVADVPNKDWLPAAILAVANAASMAASIAIEHGIKKVGKSLVSIIENNLLASVQEKYIAKDYQYRGQSGKLWHVDFAVMKDDNPILIKAVTPHHNSVAANYTAFGDIGSNVIERFCAFRTRPNNEDVSLLKQVSTLVPIDSIGVGTSKLISAIH